MNRRKPTKNEADQPATGSKSPRPPASRDGADGPSTAPADESKTHPVVAAGTVAGRGPTTTLEVQRRPVGLKRGLMALQHRDFRLFWLSQLVSLVGTWMQVLAQGWLVLVIGGSALDLGIVNVLQFLPSLAFSLFGGLLADKFPKRYLLLGTQSAAMVLAFVLALLAWEGVVNITHLMILAFLLGLVNAVDMPTRQAYVIELVGRDDLPNAVVLNSAAFNAARLAGPALAGLLIGWVGLAPAFFLNAISFLPVVAALLAMKAGSTAVANEIAPRTAVAHILEGLSYIRRSPALLLTVVVVAVMATFGINFNVIAPLLARDVLNVGADGLGLLISAMGLGALVASVLLAFLEWRPHLSLLLAGVGALGALEVFLSETTTFLLAALLLGAIGAAMILATTVANTTLQTSIPDALRGRIMSVYTLVFLGTAPIGSLFAGYLAQLGGAPAPLLIGGAICVGVAFLAWWRSAAWT